MKAKPFPNAEVTLIRLGLIAADLSDACIALIDAPRCEVKNTAIHSAPFWMLAHDIAHSAQTLREIGACESRDTLAVLINARCRMQAAGVL